MHNRRASYHGGNGILTILVLKITIYKLANNAIKTALVNIEIILGISFDRTIIAQGFSLM